MDRTKIPLDLIREKLAAEAERARHRLEKAKDILLGPLNTEIGATPYDVVYAEDPSDFEPAFGVVPVHDREGEPVGAVYEHKIEGFRDRAVIGKDSIGTADQEMDFPVNSIFTAILPDPRRFIRLVRDCVMACP